MLSKGQGVWVRSYPNKRLKRVVLKEEKTYVLVCRPEVYEIIKDLEGLPDSVMGFPKKDIEPIEDLVGIES